MTGTQDSPPISPEMKLGKMCRLLPPCSHFPNFSGLPFRRRVETQTDEPDNIPSPPANRTTPPSQEQVPVRPGPDVFHHLPDFPSGPIRRPVS